MDKVLKKLADTIIEELRMLIDKYDTTDIEKINVVKMQHFNESETIAMDIRGNQTSLKVEMTLQPNKKEVIKNEIKQ